MLHSLEFNFTTIPSVQGEAEVRAGPNSKGEEVQGEALVAAIDDAGFEAKLVDKWDGQETIILTVRLCLLLVG